MALFVRDKRIYAIVAVVVVLSAVVLGASGIDVGANDDLFNVAVQNDTSQTVKLGECSADCGSFDFTWMLSLDPPR
jgi:hypothetical protein